MGSAGSQDSKSLKTSSAPPLSPMSQMSPTNRNQRVMTQGISTSLLTSPSPPGGMDPQQSPMSISSSDYSSMLSPGRSTPFSEMLVGSEAFSNQLLLPSPPFGGVRSQSLPTNLKAPALKEYVSVGGKDGLSLYMDTETMIRNLVLPHTSTEYRNVFLLTFRAYISPTDLLDKLLAYYSHPVINTDAGVLPSTPTGGSPGVSPRADLLPISPVSVGVTPLSTSSTSSSRMSTSTVTSPIATSASSSRMSTSVVTGIMHSSLSPSMLSPPPQSSQMQISSSTVASPLPQTAVGPDSIGTTLPISNDSRIVTRSQPISTVFEIIENYAHSPEPSPSLYERPRQTLSQNLSLSPTPKTPPIFRLTPSTPSSSDDETMSLMMQQHDDRDESKSLPHLPAHWRDSRSHASSMQQASEAIQHSRRIQKLQNMSRIKVAGVLQHWIRDFFHDFTSSMKLKIRELAEEIEEMISKSPNTSLCPLTSVIRVLHSKEQHFKLTAATKNGAILEQQVRWVANYEDFPDRFIVEKFGGGIDLMAHSAESIAQQLTLIEFPIFKRIKLVELTDQSWSRKPKTKTEDPPRRRRRGIDIPAPNAVYFIKQSNRISYWCATEILLAETIEDRCDMMCLMLEVAHHALCLQNIHLCMAIIAGLKIPSISRLKHLKPVTKNGKHSKLYKKLEDLVSASSNYRASRDLFEECLNSGRPTLPFMAVIFKDLFALQERTVAEKDSDTIDIRRLCKSAKLINQVGNCQQRDYSKIITKVESLQTGLREEISKAMTEKDLRTRSLNLERKMTWEEHQQTVMIDALLNEGFL